MPRNARYILIYGLIALAWCAGSPLVAWAQGEVVVAPEGAEQRLAALAGRYGAAEKPGGVGDGVVEEASAANAPAIEDTPLGLAAGGGGGAAEGLGGTSGGSSGGGGISGGGGGWALSTLAALGVVIALIFAARWAFTKLGGAVVARPSPVVEVLSRTPVAPKNHVLLLRVGQRVLVVGDSSSGLNTLADVNDPEEVASLLQSVSVHGERSVSKSFNALVSRFNGEYEGKARASLEGGDTQEVHLDRTRDSLSGLASKLRSIGGQGGAA